MDHGSISMMEGLSESHLPELLWVQDLQAVRHDRVDHPGQADQVLQGSQCRPSLPVRHSLRWHHLGLPSLRGILENLEDQDHPRSRKKEKRIRLFSQILSHGQTRMVPVDISKSFKARNLFIHSI